MTMATLTLFHDRADAGKQLAVRLEKYRASRPLILGMPRGGMVVAFEIAHALRALLDVIVVRKLGAPGQSEFAIGAIAPCDVVVWNEKARTYFVKVGGGGAQEQELAELIAKEKCEMVRRLELYRRKEALPLAQLVAGKVVIVVDDGIATGQSALAAVQAVRLMRPQKIVLAVGVAAADSVRVLRSEVDEVVCLAMPENFYAVGQWYDDFAQTSDEEVIALLQRNRDEIKSKEVKLGRKDD